ncbi:MAG: hypothetical protein AB1414_05315 [bacterium]
MSISVRFVYLTGIKGDIFSNARLIGSWDIHSRYSEEWTSVPMKQGIGEDGCQCFSAIVKFNDSELGRQFRWGVVIDGPAGKDLWGILNEINDHRSQERYRAFILQSDTEEERYYLTHCRRLGANKYHSTKKSKLGIRVAVWAPNAQNVEVVFGSQKTGYIADDGTGIDQSFSPLKMSRGRDGVWETKASSELADFASFDHKPYMFRITKKGGNVAYRTDLYSRCQIGSGKWDPNGEAYCGDIKNLDGSKSCSVVG